MLMTENRVVDLMCNWLLREGYRNIDRRYVRQQGDDITASRNGTDIFIECKGSKAEDGGNEFSINTKYNCAASAFFRQMKLREEKPDGEVGIAFPNDDYYRSSLMGALRDFCKRNSNHKVGGEGRVPSPRLRGEG